MRVPASLLDAEEEARLIWSFRCFPFFFAFLLTAMSAGSASTSPSCFSPERSGEGVFPTCVNVIHQDKREPGPELSNYFPYTNKVVSIKLHHIYDNIKMYHSLLILTFMTGTWGAQEGIGNGGRGSFLKLACTLIASSSYWMKTTREDYFLGRKQDHNVIKTAACMGEM